ncbi:MAG: alcohol dehydrogenase catalytic domain-containing protein, partial [Chitinispirillaceae bacterium]|nr:alcohol dehydrogenase catalytic domain-containing protein [Chitinispirillaceae bacterium]
MKATVIDRFGGRNELVMREIPVPRPNDNEVLIQVRAAGVNPVDWKIREGKLASRLPHRFPLIPGWDAAGVVEQIGAGVTLFHEGDAVYAYCRKPIV